MQVYMNVENFFFIKIQIKSKLEKLRENWGTLFQKHTLNE
jgi:hypothetical protein